MKKAFFKLMLVVLGLNVFTACYGPAPGWQDVPPVDETEQTEDTKAAEAQTGEDEPGEEEQENVAPQP